MTTNPFKAANEHADAVASTPESVSIPGVTDAPSPIATETPAVAHKPSRPPRQKKGATPAAAAEPVEKRAYTVSLPVDLIEQIRQIGTDKNITASAIIIGFLRDGITRYEKRNGKIRYNIAQAPTADTNPNKILEYL